MNRIQLPPTQTWTFARLPFLVREYHIPRDVVLHVGAHLGEEVPVYRQCGFGLIRLVEPDPDQVRHLMAAYSGDTDGDIEIIAAACTPHSSDQVKLYRRERSVHSSLIAGEGEPISVSGVNMADIQDDANLIVLDTQGLELELLRAVELAYPLVMVIVETTRRRDDTAGYYDDVVEYMRHYGWIGVEEWVHDMSGYTDCVFIPASIGRHDRGA